MSLVTKIDPLAKQRLFAVIHMFGKQHLITNGDMLSIQSDFPVKNGQQILFNKCLILGGKDFSIIGKPLINKDLFRINATVIETTMTDPKLHFRSKQRNHGIRKYFYQSLPRTVFRINDIEIKKLPEGWEELDKS